MYRSEKFDYHFELIEFLNQNKIEREKIIQIYSNMNDYYESHFIIYLD